MFQITDAIVTSAYSSNGYDWVGKKKDEIYYAGSVLKLLGLDTIS